MEDEYNSFPNDQEFMMIETVEWVMALIFVILLGVITNNIYRYLILQKRYNVFLLTIFYVFAVVVAITRIIFYGFSFASTRVMDEYEDDSFKTRQYTLYTQYIDLMSWRAIFRNIAIFTKIALGYFQLANMIVLVSKVRQSVIVVEKENSSTSESLVILYNKWAKFENICICICGALACLGLVVCIVECTIFWRDRDRTYAYT